MMRFATLVLLAILAGCSNLRAESATTALTHAAQLSESGDFKGAATLLGEALKTPGLSSAERKELEFQIDILNRIKEDYTLTKDDVFAQLSDSVKGLTRAEFEQWNAAGRFDSKTIDGQTWFVSDSARNFYYLHPEFGSRRKRGGNDVAEQTGRLRISREIKKAAHDQQTPYVLPHHYICTMTVAADNGSAPAGATVRAWLPIPRYYPYQSQFKVMRSSSPVKVLAPEASSTRSAYFEQPAAQDGSAEFWITYSYTMSGVYFDMDPGKVRPADLQDPVLKKFTSEAPHIVFTDKIKGLANRIVGSETNQWREAKAFYDWVGSNIKFSYAREYSTLTNMSDYCFCNGYGDCGQEAFLFMTLCRSRGIPARWQSGWNTFPGSSSNHDWCEIYLAPYGWVPVDPWAGLYATQYCTSLTEAERKEVHDFYFGGLDYYRMAADSDHNQQLDPQKQSLRSDNVDFQRGELECGTNNIYFDKYRYWLRVRDSGSEQGL